MHVDRLSSISEALAVLLEPNSVVELRAPNAQGRTLSGYFNDRSLFAKAACAISGNEWLIRSPRLRGPAASAVAQDQAFLQS